MTLPKINLTVDSTGLYRWSSSDRGCEKFPSQPAAWTKAQAMANVLREDSQMLGAFGHGKMSVTNLEPGAWAIFHKDLGWYAGTAEQPVSTTHHADLCGGG